MKKTICRVISVIMLAFCIFAFAMCVKVFTESTQGFVDLRTFAYAIYGGVGVVSAIVAFITGKIGWTKQ